MGPGVRASTQTKSTNAVKAMPTIDRIKGEPHPQYEPSIAAKANADKTNDGQCLPWQIERTPAQAPRSR